MMRKVVGSLVVVAISAVLVWGQEGESLGDAARRVRAEKARKAGEAKAYKDATYNDDGTINGARLYERGMNALVGAEPTRKAEAAKLIRSSAELNYVPAQVATGYLAETGSLADVPEAATWYRKAAEQGDSLAGWLLGRLYLNGVGMGRDRNEAKKWIKPAADEGDPFAEYLMGLAVEEDDQNAAAEWFRKAAEQALPQAQKKYGLMLYEGRGVKVDRYAAYVWLLSSAGGGSESRSNELAQLESFLGDVQVEKAKVEARSKPTRASAAHGCTGWAGEFNDMPAPPPPELHRYCR